MKWTKFFRGILEFLLSPLNGYAERNFCMSAVPMRSTDFRSVVEPR